MKIGSKERGTFTSLLVFVFTVCMAGSLATGCGKDSETPRETVSPPALRKLPAAKILSFNESLTPLYGRIFSSHPVLVLPGHGWGKHSDKKAWVMGPMATMLIYVRHQPKGAFTLMLETEEGHPLYFHAKFDGEGIEKPLLLSHNGFAEVTVPPDKLTPGVHELIVQYDATSPRPEGESRDVCLKLLSGRIGNKTFDIPIANQGRLWLLYIFLIRGVFEVPQSGEHYGGFLFDGPRDISMRMSAPADGVFHVTPVNGSKEEAEFRIIANGTGYSSQVLPGQKGDFRIPCLKGEMDIRFSVRGAGGGFFLWGAPHMKFHRQDGKPPIILITLDTTRRDTVAPYGSQPGNTPALQAFSGSATIFTRAYATSSWTLPSHASIFTGLYPSGHGAGITGANLHHRITTMAEYLLQQGYVTAGFAGGPLMAVNRCVAQGFGYYRDPHDKTTQADAMTEQAKEFLEVHHEKTFFLFLNYFDPHFPYLAPDAFRRRFSADEKVGALDNVPEWQAAIRGKASDLLSLANKGGLMPADVCQALKAVYLSEVAYMDHALGELFEALKRHDLYEKSLIIVAADHGEFLGERGFIFHSYRLDPELMHIPLMIKWPDQKTTRRIDANVSLVDLFPTVLQAAGVAVPYQDGLILPEDADPLLKERRYIFMEEHGRPGIHPLWPDIKKISDELYGVVARNRIITAWKGGSACYRCEAAYWVEASCETHGEADIDSLRRYFGKVPFEQYQGQDMLSEEEYRNLQAMGYLQ